MANATAILDALRSQLDTSEYKKLHWEGSFSDYLNIVMESPGVTRTAYQRLYDMILSHGTDDVYENKDRVTRFKFFSEFATKNSDGIYGLDRPLMQLANTFKSADGSGIRNGTARDTSPRTRGQCEIHHRAASEARPGGVWAYRCRYAFLVLLEKRRGGLEQGSDARRTASVDSGRAPSINRRVAQRASPKSHTPTTSASRAT